MTSHYQNPYLPHTLRADAPPPPVQRAPRVAVDTEGLPIGTAAQVLEWVGDDPARAQACLTKEQRDTRPRVSLVANLKAVLKRHEIVPEPPVQLAPQIDVIPAERAEGEPVEEPVNHLEVIRERLRVEAQ